MTDSGFLSFDEAMQALGISEDELLNLVAANEIRAFRIDREMRFKEADVQTMVAKGGAQSPAVAGLVPALDEDATVGEAPPELDLVDAEVDLGALEVEDEALELEVDLATVEVEDEASVTVAINVEPDETAGTILLDEEDLEDNHTEIVSATELGLDRIGESTETALEASDGQGLGTEEIIFEDDDLEMGTDDSAVGTQEVTVMEEAVGEDVTLAAEETGETLTLQDEPSQGRGRSGRASSMSGAGGAASGRGSIRRRSVMPTKVKGNPVMAGFLVITALMMFYPLSLFVNIAWQGFTTGPSVFPSGMVKNDGYAPEMGSLFVPSHYEWFREKCAGQAITTGGDAQRVNVNSEEWWGQPAYKVTGIGDTEMDLPAEPEVKPKEGEKAEEKGEEPEAAPAPAPVE